MKGNSNATPYKDIIYASSFVATLTQATHKGVPQSHYQYLYLYTDLFIETIYETAQMYFILLFQI